MSLSSACLQEKVERRPGAESQYGFDNIYASWRDAPPVQDWYQGREDGSAAAPAADIARPSEELQNAAVASIGVRPGQDKDASEPLSFDELLRIDTKTLTRKEKLDMEAHLSSSEKLALRKARISLQMKGRRPWNTGRSHPEGTSFLTQAHFCHCSNLKISPAYTVSGCLFLIMRIWSICIPQRKGGWRSSFMSPISLSLMWT